MRGDLILFVLKTLQVGALSVTAIADLLDEHSIRNTNASFWGHPIKSPPKRRMIFEDKINSLSRQRMLAKMVSKLKSEGLVVKDKQDICGITKNGIVKLGKLLNLRSQTPNYVTEQSNEVKIITFDIPESKRSSRVWLRQALKNLRFNFLQKSVWVGKTIIPHEFLSDLRQREIFDFVEILAVTKKGTLRQI